MATPSLVVPGDRDQSVVAFEDGVVSFFIDAAELMGVPKSVAAIYGIVFASPEPLSFSDIVSRLHFSSGSVSQGLKALREIGAVRIADPEFPSSSSHLRSRRDRFEPDVEMRKLIQRFIEQRLETQLKQGNTRLTHLEEISKDFEGSSRKVIDERLRKIRRWHNRTRAAIPVVKTFLKLSKKIPDR